jgi:hypothetical protein
LKDLKENPPASTNSTSPTSPKKNIFEMDPEMKKKLIEELKVFQGEKVSKEIVMDNLLKAKNKTESHLKSLDNDKMKFNLIDSYADHKESKYL